MKTLFITGLIIVTGFLYAVIRKHGWQKSISFMYYKVEERDFFRGVLLAMALPGMIICHTPLTIIAGIAVIIVGLSPDYNDKNFETKAHMFGSYLAVLAATASIWIDFHLWWLSIAFILFIALARLLKMKHGTFWIETVCYYLMQILILIYIL
jgi:hypothetical protein